MTEDKKVIMINDQEYTEDQLTDKAKFCIEHIASLDRKIGSAMFNLDQLQVGREAFAKQLEQELEDGQENSSISA